MIPVPFTILIDSMEQQPFAFDCIAADATEIPARIKKKLPPDAAPPLLTVPTRFQSLGSSRGDYSVEGLEGVAHIERKSQADAWGTILGYGERRERFERELEFLAGIECSAVVVECSLESLLAGVPQFGKRTIAGNRKQLFRQLHAWAIDYRVPWFFYGSRAMAEVATFRILQRCWKRRERQLKETMKLIDSL